MCPEAVDAFMQANMGNEPSYGEDKWTKEACDYFRDMFETDCEVFFVFNGTAANGLALASLCQSYNSIICHHMAHIETDECGAPEFYSHGSKLLLSPDGPDGKLLPSAIDKIVNKRKDIHYPKPKVISLTQTTEVGTVYQQDELLAIKDVAKTYDLKVHMDGARFSNAVASLGLTPRQLTVDAGVDVLCLGGSKNGLAVGEAVIFFNRDDAKEFAYRCKQAGQLASKMRFISSQWLGLLKTNAWLGYAQQANARAQSLSTQLQAIPEITLLHPSEANSVFFEAPENVVKGLQDRGWKFYTFIGSGVCRLMCSWNTEEAHVTEFVSDLKEVILQSR